MRYINGGTNEPSGYHFSDEDEAELRAEAIELLTEADEGFTEADIERKVNALKDAKIN